MLTPLSDRPEAGRPLAARDWPPVLQALTKLRLTGLVVATAAAGYAVAPAPLAAAGLVSCLLGTGLLSGAANTVNQLLESPYDAQMSRTAARPLVRARLPPEQAALFAGGCAVTGTALLAWGCNPLTAGLGLLNLGLYTAVYTPAKRYSPVNTTLGAVVGALPPLMGWAACAGALEPNAFVLATVLFCWQFPHFHALSWNLRGDYSRAGYPMASVTEPRRCQLSALSYSLALIPLCSVLAPLMHLTSWSFAWQALPLNLGLTWLAYRFRQQGDSASSRRLFRYTLVHLPLLMLALCMASYELKSEGQLTPVWIQHALALVSSSPPRV